MATMTRTDLYDLANKAEQLDLINWRQKPRVIAGQIVNVRGVNMIPEALKKEVERLLNEVPF